MTLNKFNLLFFGSDKFSVRVLEYLLRKDICPIQVVTKRHTLLDEFSSSHNIKSYRWPLENTPVNNISKPNIGLVASFGHLIDAGTVNIFKYGLFNVHPSLLPKYRGSTPIQTAIKDGINKTGCTIMRIPPIAKFDIGDVILQEPIYINYREFAVDLRDRLADLGASLSIRLLQDYDQCMSKARPQSEEGKSYAKKITPESGLLRFKSEESKILDQKVRAYTGFTELYTLCLNGLRVKLEGIRDPKEVVNYQLDILVSSIMKAKKNVIVSDDGTPPPGTMFLHIHRKTLCIKCADGNWIAFDFVTPEFKSRMSALDFYNGYLSRLKLTDVKTDL